MYGKKTVKYRHFLLIMMAAFILPSILFKSVLMLMFVPSESMYPSLKVGDILIGPRNPTDFVRGDILVFTGPNNENLIKRLIGLSGDHVNLAENGDVYINYERLDEPYIAFQRFGRTQEFDVPAGYYLFLGDNRTNSMDARYWEYPYISSEKILAKASFKISPGILVAGVILIVVMLNLRKFMRVLRSKAPDYDYDKEQADGK